MSHKGAPVPCVLAATISFWAGVCALPDDHPCTDPIGGRLELYKSCSFDKFLEERDDRQARVRATVEAQERERKRMQGFIDRMGAKASKATQAKDREGKLRKLAIEQVLSSRASRKRVVSRSRSLDGRSCCVDQRPTLVDRLT